MGSRLFVGNLPYSTTEDEVKSFFASKWGVVDVRIVTDRETGRSRGFGFVELDSPESAAAAIAEMDGNELGGRRLAVREAHERQGGNRRPRRRFDGARDVAVDTAPRRSRGGFRGDGPPRRGNGGRRFDGPPPGAFDGPPMGMPVDLDDGAKSKRRERRRKKKRHDSDGDDDM